MAGRACLLLLGCSVLLVLLGMHQTAAFPLEDEEVMDDSRGAVDSGENTRMGTLNRILKNLMVEKRRFGCGAANCGRPCYQDEDGTIVCGRRLNNYRKWR